MPRRPDQAFAPPSAPVAPGSQSGIFRGFLVIIFGTGPAKGLFVYSGTPAAGNVPVLSIVAPGVTSDPFGNAVMDILEIQGTNGQKFKINIGGTGEPGMAWYSGASEENVQAAIFERIINPGASQQLELSINGPGSTGGAGTPGIVFLSAAKDGSAAAAGVLTSGNSTFLQWAGGQGLVQKFASGQGGGVPASQRDIFTRTANTNGLTPISTAYTVPASEVVAGMEGFTYRVKAAGTGTWSNASSGALQVTCYGSSRAIQSFALPTTLFTSGDAFEWTAELDVVVATVGTTGSAFVTGTMCLVDTVAKVTFTMTLNALVAPFTVNTTLASTLQLNWSWAGTGGSISCRTTELNRIPCQPAV